MDFKHWISVGLVVASTLFATLVPPLFKFLVKRWARPQKPVPELVSALSSLPFSLLALALDAWAFGIQISQSPLTPFNHVMMALTVLVAAVQVSGMRARVDLQVLRKVLRKHKKELIAAETEIQEPILSKLELLAQGQAEIRQELTAIQRNRATEKLPETITPRWDKRLAAHDEMPNQNKSVDPFPIGIPNITTTDLHAGIIAMARELHEKNGLLPRFTHVKAEKIVHMVEAQLGINLGREPIKDAAGPSDFQQLQNVEHRARTAKYFDFKKGPGGTYRVYKLEGFDHLIKRSRAALGNHCVEVDSLLAWMLRMKVQQAEIVATVFAAWNNLLLEGKQPTDDQIVYEARENWHLDKLDIDRHKFFAAVQWLRQQRRVPQGKGKPVKHKRAR